MKRLNISLIVAFLLMISFSSCGRINVRGDGHGKLDAALRQKFKSLSKDI